MIEGQLVKILYCAARGLIGQERRIKAVLRGFIILEEIPLLFKEAQLQIVESV